MYCNWKQQASPSITGLFGENSTLHRSSSLSSVDNKTMRSAYPGFLKRQSVENFPKTKQVKKPVPLPRTASLGIGKFLRPDEIPIAKPRYSLLKKSNRKTNFGDEGVVSEEKENIKNGVKELAESESDSSQSQIDESTEVDENFMPTVTTTIPEYKKLVVEYARDCSNLSTIQPILDTVPESGFPKSNGDTSTFPYFSNYNRSPEKNSIISMSTDEENSKSKDSKNKNKIKKISGRLLCKLFAQNI